MSTSDTLAPPAARGGVKALSKKAAAKAARLEKAPAKPVARRGKMAGAGGSPPQGAVDFKTLAREEFVVAAKVFFAPLYGIYLVLRELTLDRRKDGAPPTLHPGE